MESSHARKTMKNNAEIALAGEDQDHTDDGREEEYNPGRLYMCEYEEIPSERWIRALNLSFSRTDSSSTINSFSDSRDSSTGRSSPDDNSGTSSTSGSLDNKAAKGKKKMIGRLNFKFWEQKKKPPKMNSITDETLKQLAQCTRLGNLQSFSYKELMNMTDDFIQEMHTHKDTGVDYFKGCTIDGREILVARYDGLRGFAIEFLAYTMFRHKNIVTCIGWCQKDDKFLLVLEYMPNGTLRSHLESEDKSLPWDARYKISLDSASAILYLHKGCDSRVLHRNVKPSTILLDSNYNAKLFSFSLAKLAGHEEDYEETVLVGTIGYIDPEYMQTGIATKATDVYSFGVVLLQLATGLPVISLPRFNSDSEELAERRLLWSEWAFDMYKRVVNSELVDKKLKGEFDKLEFERMFLTGILCTQPESHLRPSMEDAIHFLMYGHPGDIMGPHLKATRSSSSTSPLLNNANSSFYETEVSHFLNEIQPSARTFSFKELQSATSRFSYDQIFWIGGNSIVYHGYLDDIKMHVAIKRIHADPIEERKQLFMDEMKATGSLRHQNIIQFVGCFNVFSEFIIIYELAENGSLFSCLHSNDMFLTWDTRFKIATDLADAIFYIHEKHSTSLLHTDITSMNVLLAKDYTVKLAGFETSTPIGQCAKMDMCRTPGYLDPEVLQTGNFNEASDIYSFGIVILEIACGKMAIDVDEKEMRIHLFDRVMDLFTKGVLIEAADQRLCMDFNSSQMEKLLLTGLSCAQKDSSKRPSIKQVIQVLNSEECLTGLLCNYSAVSPASPSTLNDKSVRNVECINTQVTESNPAHAEMLREIKHTPDEDTCHHTSAQTNEKKLLVLDQFCELKVELDKLEIDVQKIILPQEWYDIGIPPGYVSSGCLEDFHIQIMRGYMSGIHKKLMKAEQFNDVLDTIKRFTAAIVMLQIPIDDWNSMAQYVLQALKVVEIMSNKNEVELSMPAICLSSLQDKMKVHAANVEEENLNIANSNMMLASAKEEHALLVRQVADLQKQLVELQDKLKGVKTRWNSLEDAVKDTERRRIQHLESLEKARNEYAIHKIYESMLSKVLSFSCD